MPDDLSPAAAIPFGDLTERYTRGAEVDTDHELENPTANDGGQSQALTLVAAVLDTNFGAGGHFYFPRVRGIATRLQRNGIQLWVPQQVVWEWAVHAHEVWQKIRREHRHLVLGGFGRDQPSEAAAELVEALQARIKEAGARILPALGVSAVQAIRDQILGTGPGKSLKGVRTGAADSAWIRDAVAGADDKIHHLVFLSANVDDILRTTRSLGFTDSEIRIARTEPELFEDHIATMVEASIEVTRRVAEKLLRQAETAQRDQDADLHDVHAPWFETSDLDARGDIHKRSEWTDIEHTEGLEIGLPQPAVIQISKVRMDVADSADFPTHTRSITFDLTLLGGILLNGFGFDEAGAVGFNENYLDDTLITIPCVIEEHPATGLSDFRQTDTGIVVSALAQFDDESEALAWILDQLSALEHITMEPTSTDSNDEDGESEYVFRGPNNVTEIARLTQSPGDDAWQLDFEQSGVSILCTFDPDARIRFDGDWYDLHPAYSVHSPASHEPFSAIGRVWRYLLSIRAAS